MYGDLFKITVQEFNVENEKTVSAEKVGHDHKTGR